MTINANKIKSFIAREWLMILSVVIISTAGLFILSMTSNSVFDYNQARADGYSDQDIQKATGIDIAQIRKDGYKGNDIADAFKSYKILPKKVVFDYLGAIQAGYTPDEISTELKSRGVNIDISGAIKEKYSDEEIAKEINKRMEVLNQINGRYMTYMTALNIDSRELDLKKTIIYFYILILIFRFTFWAIKWVRNAN